MEFQCFLFAEFQLKQQDYQHNKYYENCISIMHQTCKIKSFELKKIQFKVKLKCLIAIYLTYMDNELQKLVDQKIVKYRDLSYIQFALMPSILRDYINCLLIKQMKSYIHHLFRMLVETLYQLVPQLMTHEDSKLLLQSNKRLGKKIYHLLLIVAVQGGFDHQFWSKYTHINFYRVFVPDLTQKFITQQHKTYISSLLSYFQMSLVISDIRSGNYRNQKLDNFVQQKMPLIKFNNAQVNKLADSYLSYKNSYNSLAQKLSFICKTCFKASNQGFQQQKQQEKVQKMIQANKLTKKNTINQRSVNKFYKICKNFDQKLTFLQNVMDNLIRNFYCLQLQQARLLNHLFMEQFQSQDDFLVIKGDIFCNLVVINFLQQCYAKKNNAADLIASNGSTFKQIFQLSRPSITSASRLAYSFLYASSLQRFELFDQNSISAKQVSHPLIYDFLSLILKNYDRERQDPHYMKIVLTALLFQIRQSSKTKVIEKINQFWKIVELHKQLIKYISAWDILETISSLWILNNWTQTQEPLQYFQKSQQMLTNLKSSFIVKELQTFLNCSQLQNLEKGSPIKNNLMNQLIHKKKSLFKQILTHEQDSSNLINQSFRNSIILSQVGFLLCSDRITECIFLCLKTIKYNSQRLSDVKSELISMNQKYMQVIFICLYKQEKYYLALIAADFQPYELNFQVNQEFVNKCLTNDRTAIQFTGQLLECINSYDLLQTLAHYNQEAAGKIFQWISQQGNYQWMTQNKRKKIRISKMSKFAEYLLKTIGEHNE